MLPQPLGALEDPLTPLPPASPLARPADLPLDLSSVYTLPCSEHWAKVPLVCWTPYSTLCLQGLPQVKMSRTELLHSPLPSLFCLVFFISAMSPSVHQGAYKPGICGRKQGYVMKLTSSVTENNHPGWPDHKFLTGQATAGNLQLL